MEGNLPSPNFQENSRGGGSPRGDFVGFSSTPISGKNFKPKWGKKNRNDNWNRFGQHQQQQSQENSFENSFNTPQRDSPNSQQNRSYNEQNSSYNQQNHSYNQQNRSYNQQNNSCSPYNQHNSSSPYGQQNSPFGYQQQKNNSYDQPNNSFRGGRGRGGGGWRGGSRDGNWSNQRRSPFGGGARGRGGRDRGINTPPGYHPGYGEGGRAYTPTPKSRGYFNPGMLRDPWMELEHEMGWRQGVSEGRGVGEGDISWREGGKREFSESMIPQVGDTLMERNQDLLGETLHDGSNEEDQNKKGDEETDLLQEDLSVSKTESNEDVFVESEKDVQKENL